VADAAVEVLAVAPAVMLGAARRSIAFCLNSPPPRSSPWQWAQPPIERARCSPRTMSTRDVAAAIGSAVTSK
jgi:hypothetical protein